MSPHSPTFGLKATVSRLSLVYFIRFCQIPAMKLNVCQEITSMELNDKIVTSFHCRPLNISKTRLLKVNIRHFWTSVPYSVFGVLLNDSFDFFRVCKLYFDELNISELIMLGTHNLCYIFSVKSHMP